MDHQHERPKIIRKLELVDFSAWIKKGPLQPTNPLAEIKVTVKDPFLKKVNIWAYPGPEVVIWGRAEHKPYHIHAEGPNLLEVRVNIDTLKLLEDDWGKYYPPYLKNHLKENQEFYKQAVRSVFHKGTF